MPSPGYLTTSVTCTLTTVCSIWGGTNSRHRDVSGAPTVGAYPNTRREAERRDPHSPAVDLLPRPWPPCPVPAGSRHALPGAWETVPVPLHSDADARPGRPACEGASRCCCCCRPHAQRRDRRDESPIAAGCRLAACVPQSAPARRHSLPWVRLRPKLPALGHVPLSTAGGVRAQTRYSRERRGRCVSAQEERVRHAAPGAPAAERAEARGGALSLVPGL